MTEQNVTWLTLREVGEALNVSQREVRSMLRDLRLLATRRTEDGDLMVDSRMLVEKDGAVIPLPSMRGTLTMLKDSGYNDAEAQGWLLREDLELGTTPMQALLDGKTHAVRRVIAGLAF
ncbi:Uncharacterised protein [Actinobaculum suis]|uniref:Uncharacterized protein n=1 Tax=Actinobaculum suis TaxID=1657 RepID=A0A0K9ESM9_9ACTO|nr:Rv2175c family DNA-binding protein [Actinobaculum suis]KMY22871.1 hypothetical protein ACU19_07635 [Actinobaculum suis]OCA93914.1 hypothetical protein ACU20_07215 [Actinobaculum suis]OCA94380.1 hypothetical protein ACU21_06600 [Actinobaculum suis]VDG76642.1 Uncharacterised protein [Actinobaculum suis]